MAVKKGKKRRSQSTGQRDKIDILKKRKIVQLAFHNTTKPEGLPYKDIAAQVGVK